MLRPPQPVLDDEALAYQASRAALPESAQSKLDQMVPSLLEDDYPVDPKFCLCEIPEGEYPQVRVFMRGGAEALVRYIGSLEGKEVAAWAFLGVPLRLTVVDPKLKRRYLILPGGTHALVVPKTDKEPIETVSVDDLPDLDMSNEGWLGESAFLESKSFYLREPGADSRPSGNPNDSDEENDEDEDEDEDGETSGPRIES
jgi:hypothetical protein